MLETESSFGGFRTAVVAVLLGLLVIFTIQNVATVEVNFLMWSVALPRAIIYFIIFILGGTVGWLVRYFGSRPQKGRV